VFGLALDALEDRVRIATAPSQSKGSVTIKMVGDSPRIPTVPESNSAGRVVIKMARDHGIDDGLLVEVRKGVPAGYGLGSSAASAAAAALAFKELYRLRIDINSLVEYAAEGEIASAGTKHFDNVSASIIGGFVVSSSSAGERRFIGIKPPNDLALVVAVPVSMQVPEKKTEVARQVLPKEVPLKDVIHNVSSASTVVAGFALKDVEMIARGIDDVIVEPARKHLIPGYDSVRAKALAAGALAVTISGAGPSMISFMKSGIKTRLVAAAMSEGFAGVGLQSKTFVCRPSVGAHLA
jgi:homoserine kinase